MNTQPLRWHGGKSYLAAWLHALAPPSVIDDPANGYTHRNIVFAGGLGEFWNWLPIEGISEAVNDAHSPLENFYFVLREPVLFEKFERMMQATPFGDSAFSVAEIGYPDWDDKDPAKRILEWAWEFFVKYRMSRQGLGKDFATPSTRIRRGMSENVSAWLSAVDGLPECHERLRRVEIRNLDFVNFINKYDHPRALFYCDPPYLHETRSTTGEYGEQEMTTTEHLSLLGVLHGIEGKFMLSGYHSEPYDDRAQQWGWACHEKKIDNKASSSKTKQLKTECVWTNYGHA